MVSPWCCGSTCGILTFAIGGGYVLPMAPMHLSFLQYIQEEHERVRGAALNVAILEYCEHSLYLKAIHPTHGILALAPEHPFPAQLCQATSALSHLLASGLAPSDIIIGGDSAGGNLALVLAGHLLHPHPTVAALDLRSPFAGILLISPGIIYDPADIPMTHTTDIFHPLTYKRMFELIPLDTRPGAWAGREAVRAPKGWWARLETLAPRVLLTSGEAEVLYVQLCEFGRRLETEACGVRVESLSEPGAPHMNPVVDLSDMGDGPGMGAKRIAAWVAES
jgi:acetyl esterase/lipase